MAFVEYYDIENWRMKNSALLVSVVYVFANHLLRRGICK